MNADRKKFVRFFFLFSFFSTGILLLVASSFYLYLSPKLPSAETLRTVKLQTPLKIYSQDLKLIAEFGEKKRSPITFKDIPKNFINAILAAEDDNFFNHSGVDINGLLRAAGELLTTGHIQSGGSTITMQLARNFFLSTQQSFIRKFDEILLAFRIEGDLSKEEILTLYANKIYLGNRAYGIDAAAHVYYGLPIGELDLPQLAMIAGLPKAPSTFNPLANPSRALTRRNWILGRMYKLEKISKTAFETARNSPDTAKYHRPETELDAPYIAEMARQEAIKQLGMAAYTGGYRVITTVDSRYQKVATNSLRAGLEAYDWRHGYRGPEKNIADKDRWQKTLSSTPEPGSQAAAIVTQASETISNILFKSGETGQLLIENHSSLRQFITENRRSAPITDFSKLFIPGDLIRVTLDTNGYWVLTQTPKAQSALVAIDPDSGAIKALVGGYDFNTSHFNRASQAQRQPGSNFKPFIYTRALESGMTATTLINDAPIVFQDPHLEKAWRPENDSGKFYGPTRLRKALYLSRNLVSIRILRQLGIKKTIAGMDRFGFDESMLPNNLSLALGTQAATPLNIANGYTVFANGGYRVENHLIDRIEDTKNNRVYETNPATVCRHCDQIDTASLEPSSLQELFSPEKTLTPTAPQAELIVDERIAFIMDSILKDVIKRGTGRKALILKRGDIGGKTGTTNGPRDAWFSGYSPHLVTTVWVGFDENLLLGRREYGGSAALPIWINFMREALKDKPEIHRPQPPGLISARIDPASGQRVGPAAQGAIFEYFLQENLPPLASQYKSGRKTPVTETLPEELF